MHIIGLEVEHFKRIRVLRIKPDGSLVILGGQNGAGKTSVLDAIEAALGGLGAAPTDPVRHGARKARIVVNLGELVVERTFSSRGSQLVVKAADGTPQRSPQALLDELYSKISFDPASFARMEPKKQDAVLKELLGLDFNELDRDRSAIFAARTEENRAIKALEARLKAMPEPEAGLPAEELSSEAIGKELTALREQDRVNAAERGALKEAEDKLQLHEADIQDARNEVRDLERQLDAAREHLTSLEAERIELEAEVVVARERVSKLVEPDTAAPQKRLAEIEATNRKVRARKERDKLEQELADRAEKAEQMSAAIEGIDEKKQTALAAAKFPVPGLGFDELGVTLNGVPLEQASGAEKLRVSVAIGAALNPRVKVMLVRDGSLLDGKSMRLLAELAEQTGSQVFVERVGDGDASAIVLEDGMVRASANEKETAAEAAG